MANLRVAERLRRIESELNKGDDIKYFIAITNKDGTFTYDDQVVTEDQFTKCHEEVRDNKFVIIL